MTERNRGAGAARNRGLHTVTTQAVLFLDSDDTLHPHAIGNLISFLDETGADAVYGCIRNHAILINTEMNTEDSLDQFIGDSQMAPLPPSTLIPPLDVHEIWNF